MASNSTTTQEQIEGVIRAFENGDTETAADYWSEDGVFVDPHYPEPEYRGPAEIREALDWALEEIVEEPSISIRAMWEDMTSDSFAIEVETHHTMKDGTETDFPQVFIVESENGQIVRWQSYLPFPPPENET